MEVLLFTLIILAGYHLFVEHVIVPFCEDKIKDKIIHLIKRTSLIGEHSKFKSTRKASEDLMDSMAKTVITLRNHSYLKFVMSRTDAASSKKVKERIANYSHAFEETPELKEIYKEYLDLIKSSFAHNMSGWFIYLMPVIILGKALKEIYSAPVLNRNKRMLLMKYSKKYDKYKQYETSQVSESPYKYTPTQMTQLICG